MFVTKFVVLAFVTVTVYAQDQAADKDFEFPQAIRDIGQTLTPEQGDQAKAIATNPSSTKQQVIDGLKSFFQGIGGDAEVMNIWVQRGCIGDIQKL